jgi:hypothetical protein
MKNGLPRGRQLAGTKADIQPAVVPQFEFFIRNWAATRKDRDMLSQPSIRHIIASQNNGRAMVNWQPQY